MAYTQTNLTDVENAIVDLAKGKRVVRVTIEGKSIEYSQANIEDLKSLRADIKSELQSSSGRPRFVLTTIRKGL